MKIYTRTGDDGSTGLFGGGRVPKDNLRVEAFGTVDELNAVLGLSLEAVGDEEVRRWVREIQGDLFCVGASLATPGAEDGTAGPVTPPIPANRLLEMEGWIDTATEEAPELHSFVLPGGTRGAAFLHQARTVCRRAERAVVRLGHEEGIDPLILKYLNRLSDLLFALARLDNARKGISDVVWEGSEP